MLRILKLLRAAKERPFKSAIIERQGGLSRETQRKLIRVAIARATYK